MRMLLAGIAALVIVGCAQDSSAQDTDSFEPWIVTGASLTLPVAERMSIGVEYTTPGNHIGRWEISIDPAALRASPMYECWREVVIGAPIPECLRTSIYRKS